MFDESSSHPEIQLPISNGLSQSAKNPFFLPKDRAGSTPQLYKAQKEKIDALAFIDDFCLPSERKPLSAQLSIPLFVKGVFIKDVKELEEKRPSTSSNVSGTSCADTVIEVDSLYQRDSTENIESLSQTADPKSEKDVFACLNLQRVKADYEIASQRDSQYATNFFSDRPNFVNYKNMLKIVEDARESLRYVERPTAYEMATYRPKEKTRRKTLVLDMDETLIHSNLNVQLLPSYDFAVSVCLKKSYKVYVNLRPFIHEFLEEMSKDFELILFTASDKRYAEKVLDYIEKDKKYFEYRLYKDQCSQVDSNKTIKNLDIFLYGRSLQDIVMVDNIPFCYARHMSNGIPIKSYYGEKEDTELLSLLSYLKSIHKTEDMRDVISKDFMTSS